MNFSRIFILRPIATSLLMLAILLAGVLAWHWLPISALPEIDYPTIQVATLYPGASTDVIATSITAPLERQLGQMPGLNQMTSSNSSGASLITLQFSLHLSVDVAEQEVQAALNNAATLLPNDLPAPPIYNKVNPADTPILSLALTSPTLPLTQIQALADNHLAQKIAQVSGVGLVTIAGGQRPAVRIQVNPNILASLGLTLENLRTAIGNANVNQAKGSLDGPHQSYTINANDQLGSPKEYQDLIIAWKNGSPIRLSDVATISEGPENAHQAAWVDHKPAIILNIQRQPGVNIIGVVDRIKKTLPDLQAQLPSAVKLSVLSDRTATIRASIEDVQFELMLSVALVIMVIFLFLRNLSATIIPAITVPISLVGSFAVMYIAEFSLDNLSLMALTISTGFVVDDAIVMIENITRHIEHGAHPKEAALKGARQIGFTILSLTISLIAVLIPLLFMGDVVGRLFHEFAITLTATIIISALVSLSLTPMMCAHILQPVNKSHEGRFQHTLNLGFDELIYYYDRSLQWCLRHHWTTLIVAILTLVFTILLYILIPKGFFPLQDNDAIQGISTAPQNISFKEMASRQQQLVDIVLRDPAVESVTSFVGIDGSNNFTGNTGRLQINLKPRETRKKMSFILVHLQQQLSLIPGIEVILRPTQELTIATSSTSGEYQFSLSSPHADTIATWAPKVVERLKDLPQLVDVSSSLQNNGQQAYLEINRQNATRFGITVADIDNLLYNAFGQRIVSTIFTQTNQYRVILEVEHDFRQSPFDLNRLYLTNNNGDRIPLSAIAHVSQKNVPLLEQRIAQFPATIISFNLAPSSSLGQASTAIENTLAKMNLPKSINVQFQGSLAAFDLSLSNQVFLLISALVAVYIVLGVLYESYIHPITILSTLPSAGMGALLALMMAGAPLDIVGIIGIVLLIGIVKKNAIMMIDFALEAQRKEKLDPQTAIHQACLLRFRPILMTTLAALFGALPLMLGNGVGSELRHPLGITIVGGLILSQILTLYTTPVIYLTFDRAANFMKRHLQGSR